MPLPVPPLSLSGWDGLTVVTTPILKSIMAQSHNILLLTHIKTKGVYLIGGEHSTKQWFRDPGTMLCDFAIFNLWLLRLLCSLHPAGGRGRKKGMGPKRLCIILITFHGLGLQRLATPTCRKRLENATQEWARREEETGLVNSQVVSDPTHLFYFLIPFRY